MRPRKVKLNDYLDQDLTEKVKPLEVCVANLMALGLETQEFKQLEGVVDVIINSQVDKILNQYEKK